MRQRRVVLSLSKEYGLDIKTRAVIENLAVGEQQKVEIVKALYRGSDLLIMDEPTAVLTPQEVTKLFEILNRLRREGKSIIFYQSQTPGSLRVVRPDFYHARRKNDTDFGQHAGFGFQAAGRLHGGKRYQSSGGEIQV